MRYQLWRRTPALAQPRPMMIWPATHEQICDLQAQAAADIDSFRRLVDVFSDGSWKMTDQDIEQFNEVVENMGVLEEAASHLDPACANGWKSVPGLQFKQLEELWVLHDLVTRNAEEAKAPPGPSTAVLVAAGVGIAAVAAAVAAIV